MLRNELLRRLHDVTGSLWVNLIINESRLSVSRNGGKVWFLDRETDYGYQVTLSKRFKRIICDHEINTTTKNSLLKLRRICARQNRPVSCRSATIGEILHYEIGDSKHRENMEHMAEEVRKCLVHTQYGGKPCIALRGIGPEENFAFRDEEQPVTFLGKSELRKNEDAGCKHQTGLKFYITHSQFLDAHVVGDIRNASEQDWIVELKLKFRWAGLKWFD